MELKWLEDFLALASTGNFSKAADLRHVSQSAFSRRIKNLEFWLGVELIDRSTFPINLTEEGVTFRETAEELVTQLNSMRDDFRGLSKQEKATLSFSALHSLADTFFPDWVRNIQNLGYVMPGTRIMGHDLHDCVQAMKTGDTDFMLTYSHDCTPIFLSEAEFPYIDLSEDRFIPVSIADDNGRARFDPWTGNGQSIPFLRYRKNCLLGKVMEETLGRMEPTCQFNTIYENSMASAIRAMVLAGHGLGWLPESSIRQELREGRLVQPGNNADAAILKIRLYRSHIRSRPAVERFWLFLSSED